jgi:hypothetical protein
VTATGGTGRPRLERDLRGPAEVDGEMLRLGDGDVHSWRRAPRDRRNPRPARVSAAVEVLIAAGAAVLVLPGLGQLQRQVLVRSEGLFVLGMVLSVGVALAGAAGLHRWLGGGRRRDAVAVGVVAALLAGTAWGAVAMAGGWDLWRYLPPAAVLWAAALGSTVLAVRTGGVAARPAGAVAGVLTAFAVVSAAQTGWPLLSSYLTLGPPPVPAAGAEGTAEASPSEAPPAADVASPTFGDLCHPDELETVATTPVPGGHDVATTLTVTNVGTRDCRVEDWPSLHLLSDGQDLALNVHPAQTQPAGDHVEAVEVWIRPGESAQTQVWWPSWGAAADLDAAQELRIGIGGGEEILELQPPERWDVTRSAEAWVAPWQPAPDAP